MPDDGEVYREEFDTEAEAGAFIEGLDFAGGDHVTYEPAFQEGDKWVVEARKFA